MWLHCNATGNPKPKISWAKEVPGGDKLDKEHFTQHENGTLYIKAVRPSDDGKYYCIAGNAGKLQQVTITLKVTGKTFTVRRNRTCNTIQEPYRIS